MGPVMQARVLEKHDRYFFCMRELIIQADNDVWDAARIDTFLHISSRDSLVLQHQDLMTPGIYQPNTKIRIHPGMLEADAFRYAPFLRLVSEDHVHPKLFWLMCMRKHHLELPTTLRSHFTDDPALHSQYDRACIIQHYIQLMPAVLRPQTLPLLMPFRGPQLTVFSRIKTARPMRKIYLLPSVEPGADLVLPVNEWLDHIKHVLRLEIALYSCEGTWAQLTKSQRARARRMLAAQEFCDKLAAISYCEYSRLYVLDDPGWEYSHQDHPDLHRWRLEGVLAPGLVVLFLREHPTFSLDGHNRRIEVLPRGRHWTGFRITTAATINPGVFLAGFNYWQSQNIVYHNHVQAVYGVVNTRRKVPLPTIDGISGGLTMSESLFLCTLCRKRSHGRRKCPGITVVPAAPVPTVRKRQRQRHRRRSRRKRARRLHAGPNVLLSELDLIDTDIIFQEERLHLQLQPFDDSDIENLEAETSMLSPQTRPSHLQPLSTGNYSADDLIDKIMRFLLTDRYTSHMQSFVDDSDIENLEAHLPPNELPPAIEFRTSHLRSDSWGDSDDGHTPETSALTHTLKPPPTSSPHTPENVLQICRTPMATRSGPPKKRRVDRIDDVSFFQEDNHELFKYSVIETGLIDGQSPQRDGPRPVTRNQRRRAQTSVQELAPPFRLTSHIPAPPQLDSTTANAVWVPLSSTIFSLHSHQ